MSAPTTGTGGGTMSAMDTGPGTARTAVTVFASVTVSLAGVAVSLWAVVAAAGSVVDSVASGAVVLAFTIVGAMVVSARPANRVGWLMLAGSLLWSVGNAATDLAYLGIVADPGRVPGASAEAVAGSAVRAAGWYVLTLAVPLVFPDGHLLGRRWRWLAWAATVVIVGGLVGPVVDPRANLTSMGSWHNPLAGAGWLSGVDDAAFLLSAPLSLLLLVGVVAQLIVRWRRGGPRERQQIGLLAAAAALTVAVAPVAFLTGVGWVFDVAVLPVPFAIGFAVLARGLYDLRTAANRTLLWLTLSAVVAGAYAVVIAGVGSLLHVRGAAWLPWAAAAVVAVAFAPLRDGLQRAVNRLTYGRWDEPYEVLAALGQRLEGSADVDRLLADVTAELAGLGLREVAIRDADGGLVAGQPGTDPDAVVVPLTAYGVRVGSLEHRRPEPPLRSRDARLLDDLAGHLGGVLHAHQLTADLQRARESLVLAREEERRRLRRDLHDGLGPALAGHLLRLDLLAGKVGPRSPVRSDVDALRADLRATVLEVRRVVEGLRPPALDELGLDGALEQVISRLGSGSGVVVDLRLGELPPLSAAVEVAVFRIVSEAVTNAVRHAAATCCTVEVTAAGRALRVTVTDDGTGIRDGGRPGHGLQTMRERAEELRGRLWVTAGPGGAGTTVAAEIPVAATVRNPVGGRR
jgi:signal transduction histidine kinase